MILALASRLGECFAICGSFLGLFELRVSGIKSIGPNWYSGWSHWAHWSAGLFR